MPAFHQADNGALLNVRESLQIPQPVSPSGTWCFSNKTAKVSFLGHHGVKLDIKSRRKKEDPLHVDIKPPKGWETKKLPEQGNENQAMAPRGAAREETQDNLGKLLDIHIQLGQAGRKKPGQHQQIPWTASLRILPNA